MSQSKTLANILELPPAARRDAFTAADRKWRRTGGKGFAKTMRSRARRRFPGEFPALDPNYPVGSGADQAADRVSIVFLPGSGHRSQQSPLAAVASENQSTPRRQANRIAGTHLLRQALNVESIAWGGAMPVRGEVGTASTGTGRRRVRAERLLEIGALLVADLSPSDVKSLEAAGARVFPNRIVGRPPDVVETAGHHDVEVAGGSAGHRSGKNPPDPWHLRHVGVVDHEGRRLPQLESLDMSRLLIGIVDTGAARPGCNLGQDPLWVGYFRNGQQLGLTWVDFDGHGTKVSGLIGDKTLGIAPRAQLAIAAALTLPQGTGNLVDVLKAMDVMVETADKLDKQLVINLSWTASAVDPGFYTSLQEKMDGIPIVAAIGNDGIDVNLGGLPGRYVGILGVGSVDRLGRVGGHSAIVPSQAADGTRSEASDKPEVYAPGVGVWTTCPGAKHTRVSGTSFACAIASALTAIYLAEGRLEYKHSVGELATVLGQGAPATLGKRVPSPAAPTRRCLRYVPA